MQNDFNMIRNSVRNSVRDLVKIKAKEDRQ